MDEYYCSNCGDILNDQCGFDPDMGTWKCTSCGKQLVGDDYYEGDEGVAWFCDSCGAFLNKQTGFSDCYGSWQCSECGHTNGTTEEDIDTDSDGDIDSPIVNLVVKGIGAIGKILTVANDIISSKEISKETKYACPNCGAILNDQSDFDKDYEWTCEECEIELKYDHYDDEYVEADEETRNEAKPEEKVEEEYYCTKCNDILNQQKGFDPSKGAWTCTKCGQTLMGEDVYDGERYKNTLWYCDKCGELLNTQPGFSDTYGSWICEKCKYRNSITGESIVNKDDNARYIPAEETARNLKKKRRRAKLFARKRVPIAYDSKYLVGKDVAYVKRVLFNEAFTNITCKPLNDIKTGSPYYEGQVEAVFINGKNKFSNNDFATYDSEIVITYHCKREILVPFSSESLKKCNYKDVYKKFQDLEFSDIFLQPIKDLVTGWIVKEGSVERVTILGREFAENTKYKFDEKVIIEYHVLKKEK